MENDFKQHGEEENMEKGASIHTFQEENEHHPHRKFRFNARKKVKPAPSKKEIEQNRNDEGESGEVKPFINMYDPFG